jgi:hypothetical protein
MKKKLAGILAALMVFSMGMTVFASPSPTKDADLKNDAERLKHDVIAENSSVTLSSEAVNTDDLESVYDAVEEKAGVQCTVLAAVELSSTEALPSGGVRITFTVPGITSGTSNVRIYHKTSSGWEVKTPSVGNGYVTATFDSLSPFFVVQYNSTPSQDDGSVDSTQSEGDGSSDSSAVVYNYNTTNYYTNSNNTNSNNTSTTTNNTNSNNPTTTNNTNSNNGTSTTTYNTNSNNSTVTNTSNSASASGTDKATASSSSTASKNSSSATSGSSKKSSTTSSSSKKSTTSSSSKKKTSTTSSSSKKSTSSANSTNDNSSKNNQTVTVNVNGGGSGSSSAKGGTSTSTTSPKTGASLPALPMIAIFAVMGIAVCGKKARSL